MIPSPHDFGYSPFDDMHDFYCELNLSQLINTTSVQVIFNFESRTLLIFHLLTINFLNVLGFVKTVVKMKVSIGYPFIFAVDVSSCK